MIGYIYITKNDINNTSYIGKRQKPKFEAWYRGSGTHFKLALKKYGKQHFFTEVLEWCETVEELCAAEKKWIKQYRDRGELLYNIADGGLGGNMVDWASLPKERREEINRKNSESHKGEKNPLYGTHLSEERKAFLREVNKGRTRPPQLVAYKENQRNSLPEIVQIDRHSGEVVAEWRNWCDAGKAMRPNLRCGYAHIAECCQGKRKSAYGYKWALAEMGWVL